MGRSGTTLMVASAGGHLAQLLVLAERLNLTSDDTTWVSYDCMQARSALQGRRIIAGHGPSTRNLPNAVRNWHLSRQIFNDIPVRQVISTGSGIAVPFLMEASRRGIPAHYIESASRVDGPSLSGRMLERLASSAVLYTQYQELATRRWQYGGSVYEGFVPTQATPTPRSGLRILVTVGTHESYRFDRLVSAARAVVGTHDEVVWQLGAMADIPDLPGEICDQIPSHRMDDLLQWADVVIAHAGTGIILTCLAAGVHPVIVPRRHQRGEHVDDHQVVTARAVDDLGLARLVEAPDLSRDDLTAAMGWTCRRTTVHPFVLRGVGSPTSVGASAGAGQPA